MSGIAGPNSGNTFSDDSSTGTVSWTSPTNVGIADNTRASVALTAGQVSHYIKATDFRFDLPDDAVVTNIEVHLKRSASAGISGAIRDGGMQLVKGGTIQGDSVIIGGPQGVWLLDPTDAPEDYFHYNGSTNGLWGLSFTPADINASGFGVAFAAQAPASNGTAQADHVRIIVSYDNGNFVENEYKRMRAGSGVSVVERVS
jgi:hypothetical protein